MTSRDHAVRLERNGARLEVHGELTFATVPGLSTGQAVFPAGESSWEVDLDGVTRADSAGLALLVEWLREARRRGAELRIRNVPAQLLAIARVSGVERILSLVGEGAPEPRPEAP